MYVVWHSSWQTKCLINGAIDHPHILESSPGHPQVSRVTLGAPVRVRLLPTYTCHPTYIHLHTATLLFP